MIYHLKAADVYIAKIESTTSKEVIALAKHGLGLKRENKKVERSQIITYIRYTPKLYLTLQLSMNTLITH